jgi:catechol 2,3-dioxygenase-like lactoylglutathione lyase family enzyme/predicted nucleotidyltransferase
MEPRDARRLVERLAQAFGELPQVLAVVLAGSRAAGTSDLTSDFDLYVYAVREVPCEFRRALLGKGAEIDNRFWEPGDEWSDTSSGAQIDIMYRSPEWIEGQLDRVLVRHEAALGYSTCFWYNVIYSEALFDPRGWYRELQNRGGVAYPEGLRRAVVMKNWPVLRRNHSSYRHQIEVALNRGDHVSVQHRVSAFLASFFDIWFALERKPHPGEKRLLSHLPEPWISGVRELTEASPGTLLTHIDTLMDGIDAKLVEEGMFVAGGRIEHAAAWVADLERACGFYQRWFGATIGPKYLSATRPFTSCFLELSSGARLELMNMPGEAPRMAHLAVSLGSRDAVDRLIGAMRNAGVTIAQNPRVTGDGYYEAVVTDTEGNLVEITV